MGWLKTTGMQNMYKKKEKYLRAIVVKNLFKPKHPVCINLIKNAERK